MGGLNHDHRDTLITVQMLLAEAQKLALGIDAQLLAYVVAVAAMECQDQLSQLTLPRDGVEP